MRIHLGWQSVRIDASGNQNQPDEKTPHWGQPSSGAFDDIKDKQEPTILFIDEIDKMPEKFAGKLADGELPSNTFIGGFVNNVLDSGTYNGVNLSNTLVVFAGNIPEDFYTEYSKEALGKKKAYAEFSVNNFVNSTRGLIQRRQAAKLNYWDTFT